MIGETTVLITGKRGNGKSLYAVGLMQQEIADGRPTFASNFNDLNVPGIQLLDDPKQWESLPPGSILFVDEAQRYWRARRSGEPPLEVQAMETQRHHGITIVLLTQQPTYLDKHIRGLVDLHHHLMLEVGGKASRRYTWNRCIDDAEDAGSRETADMSIFLFPKADFGKYHSAEVHTIKAKIPRKVWMIVAGVALMGGLVFFALGRVKNIAPDVAGSSAVGDAPAIASMAPASRRSRGLEYATSEQYLAALNPRIPEVAWSAPAFDGREVASDPHVYCISSGEPVDSCQCMTEQGTRYAMDLDKCMVTARYGEPYNPFKPAGGNVRQRSERPDRGAGDSPAAMPSDDGAPVASDTGSVSQVASYGGFRGG